MGKQLDLLHGTFDTLILKAVSLGPLHGYDWSSMVDVIAGILRTALEEV